MSNKSLLRAAVSAVTLAAAMGSVFGFAYDTNSGGARWPGPTIPVRMQLGPTKLSVTDASISGVTSVQDPVNPTTKIYSATVTSPSAAFDLHGVVAMKVSGGGLGADAIVNQLTDASRVLISSRSPIVAGSGLSMTFSKVLFDGSASWDATAENAFAVWNEQMGNAQVTFTEVPPGSEAHDGNGGDITSMQISLTIYGSSFGSGVLAVTLVNFSGSQMTECDVLFNAKLKMDSYRGAAGSHGFDIHRIAIHEFGHVLGLDHPDQNHPESGYTAPANPPAAIMAAHVDGNLDSLQADDIAGIQSLYGPPAKPAPTKGRLANISTRAQVGKDDAAMIGGFFIQGAAKKVIIRAIGPSLVPFGISDALQNPILELHNQSTGETTVNDNWTQTQQQEIMDSGLAPTNNSESAIVATLSPNAAGYTAVVKGVGGSVGTALVEVYDLTPESGTIANISTRAQVGVGDHVMIGGFVIGTAQTKTIVVRALGPTLSGAGVSGALENPVLELRNGAGDLIERNDDYANADQTRISGDYGFNLEPPNSVESRLAPLLAPGRYTAIVSGTFETSGVALVEVYGL